MKIKTFAILFVLLLVCFVEIKLHPEWDDQIKQIILKGHLNSSNSTNSKTELDIFPKNKNSEFAGINPVYSKFDYTSVEDNSFKIISTKKVKDKNGKKKILVHYAFSMKYFLSSIESNKRKKWAAETFVEDRSPENKIFLDHIKALKEPPPPPMQVYCGAIWSKASNPSDTTNSNKFTYK